jgi:hypothetical protein
MDWELYGTRHTDLAGVLVNRFSHCGVYIRIGDMLPGGRFGQGVCEMLEGERCLRGGGFAV